MKAINNLYHIAMLPIVFIYAIVKYGKTLFRCMKLFLEHREIYNLVTDNNNDFEALIDIIIQDLIQLEQDFYFKILVFSVYWIPFSFQYVNF